MAERLARFHTRVHARNLHAGYGSPVVVMAAVRQEAVNRAIALGWNGDPRNAAVTIDKVEDVDPRECPCNPTTTEGTD